MLEGLIRIGYQVETYAHAEAILSSDFPAVVGELEQCLTDFNIPITEIIGSGGGEAAGTQRLRHSLDRLQWQKTNFELRKTINGVERESISHEIDHVRYFEDGTIALEIEWNNKDPFFDRDLENFKRLHAEGGIDVGIIITRGSTLQDQMYDLVYRFTQERNITSFDDLEALGLDPTRRQRNVVMTRVERGRNPIPFAEAWANQFVSDKFGAATTHWEKLMDRVRRGVGNPCPLLLIGMPASIVTFDPQAIIEPLDDTSADE
jgi:hypothetical protein